jgi:hypothetical protein
MNRRDFLKTSLAATILSSQSSCAQSLISPNASGDALLRLNPYIQPEERVENRVYDKSKSEVVAWHSLWQEQDEKWDTVNRRSYYAKKVLRTIGFVEGVSTNEKLLYIGGILVRRDYQSTSKQGFYLYFSTSLQWLSLPRRTRKDSKIIEDRYALADSTETVEGFEKGFVGMDYREFKLVEGSTIRKPTHMVYRPINSQGAYENVAPSLTPTSIETTPSRYVNRDKVSVGNVLFFDIAYRPLHFKLEIPPLIIGGVEVPMPTCFFEPFDEEKSKWVDG